MFLLQISFFNPPTWTCSPKLYLTPDAYGERKNILVTWRKVKKEGTPSRRLLPLFSSPRGPHPHRPHLRENPGPQEGCTTAEVVSLHLSLLTGQSPAASAGLTSGITILRKMALGRGPHALAGSDVLLVLCKPSVQPPHPGTVLPCGPAANLLLKR